MILRSEAGLRLLRYLIAVVLVAGLLACVNRGADSPKDPSLLPSGVTTPPGVEPATGSSSAASGSARTPLPGFGETTIEVHTTDMQVLQWCLMLAATEAQRERGLMQVTDPALGGYDGMLFRFPSETNDQFYMRNTPMPLSLVYLDAKGAIVPGKAIDGSTTPIVDMTPCGDQDGCHLYPATTAYRSAIEVPQGQMARLGIGPGATVLDLDHSCSS